MADRADLAAMARRLFGACAAFFSALAEAPRTDSAGEQLNRLVQQASQRLVDQLRRKDELEAAARKTRSRRRRAGRS